ncbi:MAG TPA: hypothetical protein VFA90_17725 [Terriglobales bacterium]|nr:hypothetical protein [Terriglobales bacterium]
MDCRSFSGSCVAFAVHSDPDGRVSRVDQWALIPDGYRLAYIVRAQLEIKRHLLANLQGHSIIVQGSNPATLTVKL